MGCQRTKYKNKTENWKKMKFMFYYLMNLPQIKPRVDQKNTAESKLATDALSSINMQKMSTPTAAAHQVLEPRESVSGRCVMWWKQIGWQLMTSSFNWTRDEGAGQGVKRVNQV